MSLWENRQKCCPTHILSKLIGKKCQKFFCRFWKLKKTAKSKQSPNWRYFFAPSGHPDFIHCVKKCLFRPNLRRNAFITSWYISVEPINVLSLPPEQSRIIKKLFLIYPRRRINTFIPCNVHDQELIGQRNDKKDSISSTT
jgi:hypothetical protein